MINLFDLHSDKDSPNSWIWIVMKPHLIKKIYSSLLEHDSQNNIGQKLNQKLNAGLSTVVKHLIRIKKTSGNIHIPLPIVIHLNALADKDYSTELVDSILSLECKNYNSQKVKPIKEVDVTLAKIIGAHVSDGYLQNYKGNYAWKVTEGKKELVYGLAGWIKEVFGFKPIVWHYAKDNMWVCSTKNKIFCRFLEKILSIPVGKKSYTIDEPEIIKNSSLQVRNAFLAGMLNFDGCVKSNGIVSLTSMSKKLMDSTKNIFDKNKISTNLTYNKNKKSFIIETTQSRDKKTLIKLLDFFEQGSYKYKRLRFFADDRKAYSIEELNELFPKERLGKVSLGIIYNIAKKMDKFRAFELANACNVATTTVYKYLYILEKADILAKENDQYMRYFLK